MLGSRHLTGGVTAPDLGWPVTWPLAVYGRANVAFLRRWRDATTMCGRTFYLGTTEKESFEKTSVADGARDMQS